jgi:hypothetical protein
MNTPISETDASVGQPGKETIKGNIATEIEIHFDISYSCLTDLTRESYNASR